MPFPYESITTHFPSNDFKYVKEYIDKLLNGDNSGMFKYIVDDSFDIMLAIKLAALYLCDNDLPGNCIITQEVIERMNVKIAEIGRANI